MEGAQQRRFRIHHGLGRGGYGEVYKATMTSPGGLRAEVAVKLLRLDQHTDEDAVRRLRDEGKLLAALNHPTILRVYDLAVLEGRIGLVTEYVEGQDLHGCIEGPDAMPVRPLVEVIGLVAEGLHAAYVALAPDTGEPMHLVHRDVKPSNLRVSRHGEVKILDFGIARSEAVDREARTGSQATLGSLAYMSPERFDDRPPGPAGDMFSLGCVLYEGLAGRRLYPDAVPVNMYRMAASLKAYEAHLEKAFAALEGQPGEVIQLVRDLLTHEPDDRVSARDVATRCEALVDQLDGPSLKRWARERAWPDSEFVQTTYDGRTLTDGTLRTGAYSPSWLPQLPDNSETIQFENLATEEMTSPPMSLAGAEPVVDTTSMEEASTELDRTRERHSAVPLLVGGAIVVLLLLLGAALVGSSSTPEPQPVPSPQPVAAPEPAPAPEPRRTQPAPLPVPVPVPAPVPDPEPTPKPEPVIVPSGSVVVKNATLQRLVDRNGRSFSSSTVPGGNYTAHIDFGGFTAKVAVRIPPRGTVTIDCNRVTGECNVKQ